LFLEWKGKGIITGGRRNRVHPVWLVDVTHSLLPPHFVQSEQTVESEDKNPYLGVRVGWIKFSFLKKVKLR